jgi:RNA polymerase sigma-70 factor (ECF subfamily)
MPYLDAYGIAAHRERLFRAACGLCGSRDDAEDLVQDTYERVLKRRRVVREDSEASYLLKALRNTWINNRRARERRPKTVELDEATQIGCECQADPSMSVDATQLIAAALRELSAPLRETVIAVDVLGLTYREAAASLGTRQGTVMSRLSRGRNQLAELLEREGLIRPAASAGPPSKD